MGFVWLIGCFLFGCLWFCFVLSRIVCLWIKIYQTTDLSQWWLPSIQNSPHPKKEYSPKTNQTTHQTGKQTLASSQTLADVKDFPWFIRRNNSKLISSSVFYTEVCMIILASMLNLLGPSKSVTSASRFFVIK